MLLLWKTPRLRVTCLQSTESCRVSDNFMCWWRFFQVALLPYHGRISSKVLCKFEVSTLLLLLEIYWNLLSRYFTVFVFCNWSLLCLSFVDWFMEYCPVAWQRHNTQVSVKQPTSGQREKRPSTQVNNAHSPQLSADVKFLLDMRWIQWNIIIVNILQWKVQGLMFTSAWRTVHPMKKNFRVHCWM